MKQKNHLINYYELGQKGTPIVFIHGWGMSSDLFSKQLKYFSKTHKIYALNLFRNESFSKPMNLNYDNIIDDLETLFSKLELNNFVIVGWSMGTHLIWKYLTKYNTRKILGIVNTEMVSYLGNDKSWATEENKRLEQNKLDYLTEFIRGMFFKVPLKKDLDWMIKEAMEIPTELLTKLNLDISEFNANKIIKNLTIPTLMIFGKNLHFFTEQQINETISLHDCEKQWFSNSKHCPFWEEPQKYNSTLLKFVTSLKYNDKDKV